MTYDNPYISPMSPAGQPPLQAELVEVPEEIWRTRRSLVVLRHRAQLPDRCVKCNAPADGWRLRRRMYWHEGWIYVTALIALLVYFILALVLRKDATVRVGLCRRHRNRRRWIIAIGWLGSLAALAGIFFGLSRNPGQNGGTIALVSFVAFLGIVIASLLLARTVYPHKMDEHFVWIRGVNRSYLADLPDWPGW